MNKIEKIKNDNYNLYYINENKSKTTEISFIFKSNASLKEMALKSLLLEYLLYVSKHYKTPRLVNLKQEELYGLEVNYKVRRNGNLCNGDISLSILNNEYTNKDNIQNSLDFIFDLLNNPLIENNKFNDKYLNILKNLLIDDSLYTLDNPGAKAKYTLLDNLGNDTLKIHNNLDVNTLKSITNDELLSYYKTFFKTNNIDIIVSSNINKEFYINYFNKLNLNNNNNYNIYYNYNYNNIFKEKTKTNNTQSKLIIAYTFDNLTDFEYKYVFNIYSHIIGGSANSLLMQIIREKESLCYGIYTDPHKLDNLLLIESGIQNNTSDRVIKEIDKIIKDKSLFNENIINNNLNDFITNIKAGLSYQLGLISVLKQLIDIDEDIQDRINNFSKVNKEDILNIIDKIRLIGYYVIEGEL